MRSARAAALLAAALAAACGGARAADEVRVRASVLPQGRIDDTTQVRLVITVEGGSIPDVSSPRLPEMKNLKVVNGPSSARSQSYVLDNGRMRSAASLTLTYALAPNGPGPAEIPPFDVSVGGTTFRTQALRFQVQAGRSGPAPPSSSRGAPDREADDESDASVDVFLQARLSETSLWAGQAAVLEITLYAAAPVGSFAWTDIPSIPGVWAEDLSIDPDRERSVVQLNGREYVAYAMARKLVVPTAAGSLTVPSFSAQLQVRRPTRDPFGAFFSLGRVVTLIRKTAPLKLEVRALPEAGRPVSFGGAVGSYRMKVTADRPAVDVGDAVAVRATVEGTGSLQSAGAPTLSAPPDVKIYEPKIVDESAGGATPLSARRTWEWVVVPLAPGTVRLPSPEFAYFDTASGTYKELRGELPEIAVRRGTGARDAGLARGEVQPNTKDIAFLKQRRDALREEAPPLHRRGWFRALLILPAILVPGGILWGRRRERFLTDHGFARARRAARAAQRRLDRAAARAGESSAFHEEVAGALVDYVADRANRPAAGLTYDQLQEILAGKGVAPELQRRYRACLEACDFARFVPDSGRPQARIDLAAEARAIVKALEEGA